MSSGVNKYHSSSTKMLVDLVGVTLLFVLALPLFILISLLVKLGSKGPIIFAQRRMGKGRKPFVIYKFRTMEMGADKLQNKLKRQNEADGPTFKIRNDPRFVGIGKWLAHSGLDELLQLVNVIKGEMSLVGPRPLPMSEARKVPKKYAKRFLVKPGITSEWVVSGAHSLSFKKWMEFDGEYVEKGNIFCDLRIVAKTIRSILGWLFV